MCSIKKSVLKNVDIFTGKHVCWSLFLMRLQATGKHVLESLFNEVTDLQACNFIKKRLQ